MNIIKRSALGASIAGFGTMISSAAFAAATAQGDKYDGFVEMQDTFQGILDNGGGFALIILSIIIAIVIFTVTRSWAVLVIPFAVGIYLSVGLDTATALGGMSAETDLYTTSALTHALPVTGTAE